MRVTREETPDDTSTHWSTRTLAERFGIGKDTVARVWRDHNIKPWRIETFKISNDRRFEEKVVDVVGSYMNPPERAAVFCFDEKPQIQALDRTQLSLPMKPGRAGTMTHDYKRNGTVDLFASMNVATGKVIYDTRKRHAGADVLAFFKLIDLHVQRDLAIHVVLDNLSAHMSDEVTTWLDHPKRARWHLHFIPTSSSWANPVERWFKELTDKRLAAGGSPAKPASPPRSNGGPNTGTTTRNPSCGPRPQRRSHQGLTRPRRPPPDQIRDTALGRVVPVDSGHDVSHVA